MRFKGDEAALLKRSSTEIASLDVSVRRIVSPQMVTFLVSSFSVPFY